LWTTEIRQSRRSLVARDVRETSNGGHADEVGPLADLDRVVWIALPGPLSRALHGERYGSLPNIQERIATLEKTVAEMRANLADGVRAGEALVPTDASVLASAPKESYSAGTTTWGPF